MRDSTHKLAVLYNRATAHECVQIGTTLFYNFLTVLTLLIEVVAFYIVFECLLRIKRTVNSPFFLNLEYM